MRTGFGSIVVAACASAVLGTTPGIAAEREILGQRLLFRNPRGDEAHRSVRIVGREAASDISGIVGDPVAAGGTLMLLVNGGSAAQVFSLDASGWAPTATGFRYLGPTAAGAPVKRVILRRTTGGAAILEITLKGSVGTQPLDLVPPDPGSDAVAVLTLTNGDAYCVSLGGAAGGQVLTNTAQSWRVTGATSEPGCPALCCSFGASCTWGTLDDAALCHEVGGTLGLPGTTCDGSTGACTPPPASTGNCCEFAGGACFGGPNVQPPPCDEIGGSFTTAAICHPDDGCLVP